MRSNYAIRRLVRFPFALGLLALAGCANKALVVIEYDHTNSFKNYVFQPPQAPPSEHQPLDWQTGSSDNGISGDNPANNTYGFWATFVICAINNNQGADAQDLNFSLSNFFVDIAGNHFHFKPNLAAYTYTSYPNHIPGNPNVTPTVNHNFQLETFLGSNVFSVPKGTVKSDPIRIAIFVPKPPANFGPADRLTLRFDGAPNFMSPRNRDPVYSPTAAPATQTDLLTSCRGQAPTP
jgi:hypothetical protein